MLGWLLSRFSRMKAAMNTYIPYYSGKTFTVDPPVRFSLTVISLVGG
jgi:hypothetical protein